MHVVFLHTTVRLFMQVPYNSRNMVRACNAEGGNCDYVVLILKNFFIYSPIGLNFIYVIETAELRCVHYLHARNR